MNEDFSLGKMSADARLTATFNYYEKTEQNGKIVITPCLGEGDVPKLNRGYGLNVFFATPNYQKMQNVFPKVAAGNSSFLHVPPA